MLEILLAKRDKVLHGETKKVWTSFRFSDNKMLNDAVKIIHSHYSVYDTLSQFDKNTR